MAPKSQRTLLLLVIIFAVAVACSTTRPTTTGVLRREDWRRVDAALQDRHLWVDPFSAEF